MKDRWNSSEMQVAPKSPEGGVLNKKPLQAGYEARLQSLKGGTEHKEKKPGQMPITST